MAFFDKYDENIEVPPTKLPVFMACEGCKCSTRRYITKKMDGKKYLSCYWCGKGPVITEDAIGKMKTWTDKPIEVEGK